MTLIIHCVNKQIQMALRYLFINISNGFTSGRNCRTYVQKRKAGCCSGDHILRLNLNLPEEDLR